MVDEDQRIYLHFKSLNREQLIKLLSLLDDDFTYLKEIIKMKIDAS
jgi:hypothetical protein